MTTCNHCGQPMHSGASTLCPLCIREMLTQDYADNEPADDLDPVTGCGPSPLSGKRPDQLAFSMWVIAALCVIGLIGLTLGIVAANLTAP